MNILVTGGAGYVGSALVPRLLALGHVVTVLDLYLFGRNVIRDVIPREHQENLIEWRYDIRDIKAVRMAVKGCDTVIHLASISNDPCWELDPRLAQAVDGDAFQPLVKACKKAGVQRFIYASSSSVYGKCDLPRVMERMALAPMTPYSQMKALNEKRLLREATDRFCVTIVRPGTVCGMAPRLRLDVIVNLLVTDAVCAKKITVFGGSQHRAHLHIDDMVEVYVRLIEADTDKIHKQVFNAARENYTIFEVACMVQNATNAEIVVSHTEDARSYRIDSSKLCLGLGFTFHRTVPDAILEMVTAHHDGLIPDALKDDRYYNVRMLKKLNMK